MKPRPTVVGQEDLFRSRLTTLLNPKDPFKKLGDTIDWKALEDEFGQHYRAGSGYPPKPIRLMVSLLMLEYIFKLSDEQVVQQWVRNPYWQYLSGYDQLQWHAPIDPSSLTRFRQRIGVEGAQKLLQLSIQLALQHGMATKHELTQAIADTTVMEKNIAHPTDTALLNRARKKLVKKAKKENLKLRQTYERLGRNATLKAGRYAHAKQFKRMNKQKKKIKTYLGRVVRDVERKTKAEPEQAERFTPELAQAKQLLAQEQKSRNKCYSLHEPHVYCIAKGKARKPYEFGTKVSIVTTKRGLIIASDARPTNQHDAATLKASLQLAEQNSTVRIKRVLVDKGYRGHKVEQAEVHISGQRRGLSWYMRRELKKRSAIEPHIGHMKNEGKLGRCFLKGFAGDQINAVMCAVAYNLRRLALNYLIVCLNQGGHTQYLLLFWI